MALRVCKLPVLIAACALGLFAADAPVAGTWRAQTATLKITEAAPRTYRITFGDEAMTLGLVPAEITVACDGRERPLAGAAHPGTTALCLRTFPNSIKIRLRENDAPAGELDFLTRKDAASLRYIITKAGRDTAFLLERQ